MRKSRILLVPFCAMSWIVGVYSFERWVGGTICVSSLAYISKEDVFLSHSDHALRSQYDFEINNIPTFDKEEAKKFYDAHSERFELVRLMSIRRPDQYWRSFFLPFSRQVDIRIKTYDDPEYDPNIDSRNRRPVNSVPVPACQIYRYLHNKKID